MPKPKNKKPVYTLSIEGASFRLAGYSLLLVLLGAGLFSAISSSGIETVWMAVAAIFIYFATLTVHELVHGLAFMAFGGKVKYGVGVAGHILPYAYATAPDQPFTLRQMLVIGLAPFVVLCSFSALVAILLPQTAPYMGVVFIGNFAGAVGDLWMVSKILKFRGSKNLVIVDEKQGMTVYADDAKAKTVALKLQKQESQTNPANKFIVSWIGASFVLMFVALLAPILFTVVGFSGSFSLGPSWFQLISYESGTQVAVTVNFLPAIAGGFVFAVLKALAIKTYSSAA